LVEIEIEKDRKEAVKAVIKRLHSGEDPEKVKEECKDVLRDLTPNEIGMIEQELIEEGMKVEEVQSMCDAHLSLLKENVEKEGPELPNWHPVHILKMEHNIMLEISENLRELLGEANRHGNELNTDEKEKLKDIVHHLKDSESHYLREENVLFPHLEKHGITQPPAIMWMEHDNIRAIKKDIFGIMDKEDGGIPEKELKELGQLAIALSETLSNHFYKESNVLFPMGLNTIGEGEWKDVRKEFDELGYCCFTPEVSGVEVKQEQVKKKGEMESMLVTETGSMTHEEIESIFNTLPVDITFVGADDTVRYFSEAGGRIFVRTKSIIGRKVQQCHPQKSIHLVNEIVEDFKSGKRDVGEFWIDMKGKKIYIRYFPVRNAKGEYLGCIEVSQDVTAIKKLEGEKRLL
jgi:PAS domain S-box-containing protein